MSLKAVHLAFILFSTALCIVFAAWLGGRYSAVHEGWLLVGAVVSGVAAIALLVYARKFLRKMRNVRYL
jgi:hypothetical protein